MEFKFSLLAADTSRSRIYLKALQINKLLPNYVILLDNINKETTDKLPGQINNDCDLEIIIKNLKLPYEIANTKNINSDKAVDLIKKLNEEIVIYSGYGGGILREKILSTNKKFLHVHGGYLPDFKGSTTNYYSLLSEKNLGASSIFLTSDIDGGPVLIRKKFKKPKDCKNIDHETDSFLRAEVLVETLKMLKNGKIDIKKFNNQGNMYYIIHPVLKHIAMLAK